MHIPVMLASKSKGCPPDFTRRVMVGGKNVAEMHGVGPGPAGGGTTIAQPDTINGGLLIGTGVPIILTRGLGVIGLAGPPCIHITTQFIVNK